MLPATTPPERRARAFGVYNAVAAVAGSIGALAAGLPAFLHGQDVGSNADHRWFLVLVPIGVAGAAISLRLTPSIEATREATSRKPLERSKTVVGRLAGLFAVDSFAGGFVVQAFIAYWLSFRYGASVQTLAVVFFCIGVLQSLSFLVAWRLADRFGLLNTMVFTHIPSNILLAAVPFAPNLTVAVVLLFARFALSQMDVPTRQAYVAALVDPDERPAAAAYTNTARYVVRPAGAALAGLAQKVAIGLPFIVAGGIKIVYDLAIYGWFAGVRLPEHDEATGAPEPPGGAEALEAQGDRNPTDRDPADTREGGRSS